MVTLSTIVIGCTARKIGVADGDSPSYLNAAYHIAHHGTLSESANSAAPSPGITREPGYAFVLSLLMRVDPGLKQRFDLNAPGGFYDEGQNGYSSRLAKIMQTDNIGWQDAARILDRQITGAILSHPFAFALTTLPIFCRGIWIDEFSLKGTPLLICIFVWTLLRREWLLFSLVSIGVFNHLFYSCVSLGIPRYQLTALPSTALAVAVTSRVLIDKRWWPVGTCLSRREGRLSGRPSHPSQTQMADFPGKLLSNRILRLRWTKIAEPARVSGMALP